MQWDDQGIVLSVRRHGEGGAILHFFGRAHGLVCGYMRRASDRRVRNLIQPGRVLEFRRSARLQEQTGHIHIEDEVRRVPLVVDMPQLLALQAMLAQLRLVLQDNMAIPGLYDASVFLLRQLADDTVWAQAYVSWELILLREMGYALDLRCCALSGERTGLAYISPRTGRAATAAAVRGIEHKLLKLPAFVLADATAEGNDTCVAPADICDGLRLTTFFLHHRLYHPLGRDMPEVRVHLLERIYG